MEVVVNRNTIITLIVGIFVVVMILVSNISLRSEIDEVKIEMREMQNDFYRVSAQLEKLISLNSIVSDTEYHVDQVISEGQKYANVDVRITSSKLGNYSKLKVLYRPSVDIRKEQAPDNFNDGWEFANVERDHNVYMSKVLLSFAEDYEFKLCYFDDGEIEYVELPSLELYSKAESTIKKDINIYGIKKGQLNFDVQIAQFKSEHNIELLSAMCNVYYDNQKLKAIDILEENKKSGRKTPKAQLESAGGDYWFVIESIDLGEALDFEDINKLDTSNISIELVLEDSLGNTYVSTDYLGD